MNLFHEHSWFERAVIRHKWTFVGVVLIFAAALLGACSGQSSSAPIPLPTVAVLPTQESSPTPLARRELPATWTPTDTPPTATATLTPIASLTPFGGSDSAAAISNSALVSERQVLVTTNDVPLRVSPGSDSALIEYVLRGAVRTVLTTQRVGDVEWLYVADGYGWMPSQIGGTPTTQDYSLAALQNLIVQVDAELQNDRGNSALWLQRGWMNYSLEDYAGAISDITVAIESSTDPAFKARLYEYLGKVYLDAGDYTNALDNFNDAVELGLETAALLNRRAIAYKGLGRFGEARADYDRAVELNPEYGLLYSNIGALIDDAADQDPAQVGFFDLAIEVDPNYPYAYSNRATFYRVNGEFSDSLIEDYTTALNYLPNDDEILNNRGIVYSNLGDFSLAVNDFTRAIELGNLNAYANRGAAYAQMGQRQSAVVDFLNIIEKSPESDEAAIAYYNLGIILTEDYQIDAAVYAFDRALAINPNYTPAQINRAAIYGRYGGITEYDPVTGPDIETLIEPITN